MSLYKFETERFGLSDTGLHLLRGRYNYKTIAYAELDEIVLDKGHQVNNWFLSLIIGLALVAGSLFLACSAFLKHEWHAAYMGIVLTTLPVFLGAYIIYFSLKIGFVLKIRINEKVSSFPIEQLKKQSQIGELVKYLEQNNLTRRLLSVNFPQP